MGQEYSNPARESNPYSLPNIEVFQLTARKAAGMDGDLVMEYARKHEYRLAHLNGKVQDAMLDAIVKDNGITGGYFYWYCLPGCLPDSSAIGPFKSYAEALADARENSGDMEEEEEESEEE